MKHSNDTSLTRLNRSHHWPIALTSVALLLTTLAGNAYAEDDSSDAVSLPSLTVEGNKLYNAKSSEETKGYSIEGATVGTKTPAPLKDIPQSITVLTHDYIEDRDLVHLDDAAKATPGLRTLSNDSGRSSIYSRGYEYDEINIDGLPAPMESIYGTLPSLSAFDRIEVMRGPSGLFNSTSELGGIVNLVRKRATAETQGTVSAGVGSWDRNQVEADVSGALNKSKTVRGRMVISQDDMPSESGNENKDRSIYGTLDMDLNDSTVLSLGVLHQKKDITPDNGLPTYADGTLLDVSPSTFLGADWNDFNATITDFFAELTHDFDNGGHGRIAARSSHRDVDYHYAFTGRYVDSDGNTTLRSSQRDYEQDDLSLDASYSQPFETFGNVSEFVVGTDYKHYDTSYLNGATSLGSINIYTFDSSDVAYTSPTYSTQVDSDETEKGVYSKLTFRPIKDLALIAGGRFSWYDLESSTTTLSSGTKTSSGWSDSARFTPYGGAVYNLTPNQSLYTSYSEVYKPQTDTDENGDMIAPRTGKQYEIGLKGSYDNGRLNSHISVFQLTDANRATTAYDSDGNDLGYSVATGKARVSGFEAELSGHYGPWDLLAGYSYMETKNISGDENALFTLMPKHTVTLWSKYTMESAGIMNGVSIGGGIHAMSDFYYEYNDVRVNAPGYAVVDAEVSKQITKNLKVSLNVNNLLNKTYYERVGTYATFNMYGDSRNVMAKATYQF